MTDYIEEMMKTAGCKMKPCSNDVYDEWCVKYESCNNAPHCFIYPDFTAEKQLELIKLIGLSDYNISIYKKDEGTVSIAADPNTFKYTYSATSQDFTQALAQLTTELINAGELDKEKVKEILKDAR